MKIHEYQAKNLLRRYGVSVPNGNVAFTIDEAVRVAEKIGGTRWVVKAQIHAGGRGKAGGVKFASSLEEVRECAGELLGMRLITHQTGAEGRIVRRLLIEQGVAISRELYVGITLDRQSSQHVCMASSEGGMDIETVAAQSPEKILKEYIDPLIGFRSFQARRLCFGLGLDESLLKRGVSFLQSLYNAYCALDASLIEVNPMVITEDGMLFALDAKIVFDDNALFRHPEYEELRDVEEEEPLEIEASAANLNYIKLDGNVGCMVNGAGLAMATMDMIKLAGGLPANFLDIGGGAGASAVETGFKIILEDSNVKAILVNIFGGIVRCDLVARGIIEAAKNVEISVPIVVRLAGTNADVAAKLLQQSGVQFRVAQSLSEAATMVTSIVQS
ncbi:MAG TPA: ADP-forming succinate--CoA ligase subunit beta [Bacteroidota bacterium]|nr:ADP-forming succinate--CoA ligase subunit beta [Bacteroidota bacterium]